MFSCHFLSLILFNIPLSYRYLSFSLSFIIFRYLSFFNISSHTTSLLSIYFILFSCSTLLPIFLSNLRYTFLAYLKPFSIYYIQFWISILIFFIVCGILCLFVSPFQNSLFRFIFYPIVPNYLYFIFIYRFLLVIALPISTLYSFPTLS